MSINRCIVLVTRKLATCNALWSFRSIQHIARDGYLHNPGTEPLSYLTLGEIIKDTAHKYPGRVAVKSIYENISLTYEELLTKADSLAYALRENGFDKGDTLGLWSHNSLDWIVSVVAATRAGLIAITTTFARCLNLPGCVGYAQGSWVAVLSSIWELLAHNFLW